MNELSHHLYTFDGAYHRNITEYVENYRHELTEFGPHIARFKISTEMADEIDLADFFNTWLMMRMDTLQQGVTVWSGYVWEMELDLGGYRRNISAENIRNRVKTSQQDQDDRTITRYSAWYEDTGSQDLYGVREYIERTSGTADIVLDADGAPIRDEENAPIWEFDWLSRRLVENYAFPVPAYSAFSGTTNATMTISLVGRATIANKVMLSDGHLVDSQDSPTTDGTGLRDNGLPTSIYSSVGYDVLTHGSNITVSQEIRRIINVLATNGDWLRELHTDMNNDTMTAAGVGTLTGAVSRLRELVKIPARDGTEYAITVMHDGGIDYRPRTDDVDYLMYPDGLKTRNGDPVGWDAQMGRIEILDPAIPYAQRYMTPERLTVANGKANFVPLERTEIDTWFSIQANKQWRKRNK